MATLDSDHLSPGFPTTQWSRIARRDGVIEDSDWLARSYWRPVYSTVRLAWNRPHHDAKDLTQEFFTRLIEGDFAAMVDPSKGRFRDFLRAALKNFMLNEKRDTSRLKRGGRAAILPIEELQLDPADADGDPALLFDRMWARDLLAAAVESVERRLGKRAAEFWMQVLRRHDMEAGAEPPSYANLAEQLGTSVQAVKKALEGARRELRAEILRQVRRYASDEDEVQAEIQELFG